MRLSEKVVNILVLCAVLTLWSMVGQSVYNSWLESQGASIGVGEVFIGFLLPALVATVLSAIIIRRLRRRES